jgi:hypothetical protein
MTSSLEKALVENQVGDQPVLNHIRHLVAEEPRLYGQWVLYQADRNRIVQVQVEPDRCRDLVRQRCALRAVGLDPGEAKVRPQLVVENYEQ